MTASIETTRCVHTVRIDGEDFGDALKAALKWWGHHKDAVIWDMQIDHQNRLTIYHDGFEPKGDE